MKLTKRRKKWLVLINLYDNWAFSQEYDVLKANLMLNVFYSTMKCY